MQALPVSDSPPRFDLTTQAGRRRAERDFWWADHAFLRARFQNAHQISPRMWRSNQPSPAQLAVWRDQHGIRTVVNLRGDNQASYTVLEKDACARLGLDLVFLPTESRGGPHVDRLQRAREAFETMAYPALMHCKSGADRAGSMSVFYLHLIEGVPIATARQQLAARYLHVEAGKTGILGYFWDEWARAQPDVLAHGRTFWDWLESDYDRDALKARFKPTAIGSWLSDTLLRRE
jgi:protein tyrosine/serine phosphatase